MHSRSCLGSNTHRVSRDDRQPAGEPSVAQRGVLYALVRVQSDNYEADRSIIRDRGIICDRNLWLAHTITRVPPGSCLVLRVATERTPLTAPVARSHRYRPHRRRARPPTGSTSYPDTNRRLPDSTLIVWDSDGPLRRSTAPFQPTADTWPSSAISVSTAPIGAPSASLVTHQLVSIHHSHVTSVSRRFHSVCS